MIGSCSAWRHTADDKDKLICELGADEIARDGRGLAKVGGADVILGTSNSDDAMADSIAGLRPDGRGVCLDVRPKGWQKLEFRQIAA